jgi:hypothetical protein
VSNPRTRLAAGVAAWLVAVCAALAVGLSAVGAIGTGLLGPAPQPLTPAEVDARLASTDPAVPGESATPTAVAGPVDPGPFDPAPVDAPSPPEVIATSGGTVLARCTGGRPEVVAATPAQGFRVQTEDEDGGPRIRFRAGGDRVEVHLTCANGRPVASVATG